MGIRGSLGGGHPFDGSTAVAPTTSGGTAGTGAAKNVVDDFGAVGDGTTDDRAAFQAAHNWAKANNGTVFVPPARNYAIYPDGTGKGLVFDSWGWRWTGGGTGSRLIWKGGLGTGPLLSVPSQPTGPFEIDHLRFSCDNAAHTDKNLVEIYGTPADVQEWDLHHCDFEGFAKALLYIQKVVIARIEFCRFNGDADYGIWMGINDYVTAFQVDNCVFNSNNVAHIQIDSFDNEMVTISENTFEAGTNTPAVVTGANAHCANLLIEKNWCGDASGVTNWFQINGDVWYCATFIGNAIVNGAPGSHGFTLGNGHFFFFGNEVIGANTTYALKSSTGNSHITDVGNEWQLGGGTPMDGTYGSWWNFTATANSYPTFPPPLVTTTAHAAGSNPNNLGTISTHGYTVLIDQSDVPVTIMNHANYNSGAGDPIGTLITLISDTPAGNIPPFVKGEAGVTINAPNGMTIPRFRSGRSVVYAWQKAQDVWYVFGDLLSHRRQWEYAGATRLLELGNDGDIIVATAAGAATYTVPAFATAAFAPGAEIDIIQGGTGQVTIAPDVGVTLHSKGGLLHTSGQYGRVKLLNRTTNEWIVTGDLS